MSIWRLLVVLALAVAVGLSIHAYPGMLIFTWAGWRVDMPLWVGIMGLLLAYCVAQLFIEIGSTLFSTGGRVQAFWRKYKRQRAQLETQKGWAQWVEGNFAEAQKLLSRSACNSTMPWFNYIFAALATKGRNADAERERYFSSARASLKVPPMAMALTRAKLYLEEQKYEKSKSILTTLYKKAPHHKATLSLLFTLYNQMEDWEALQALLPKCYRHKILDGVAYEAHQKKIGYALLKNTQDLAASRLIWLKLSKACHTDAPICLLYAQKLQAQHYQEEAEKILRKALQAHWSEALIYQYGTLQHPQVKKLLAKAEEWRSLHEASPGLLFALGRFCVQLDLWGKAQRYFEASLTLAPTPIVFAELGALFEKMHQPERGVPYYKKGLLHCVSVAEIDADVAHAVDSR